VIPGSNDLGWEIRTMSDIEKENHRMPFIFKGASALGRMRKFRWSVTALSIPQRLKLPFWVAARTLVNTVKTGVRLVKKA